MQKYFCPFVLDAKSRMLFSLVSRAVSTGSKGQHSAWCLNGKYAWPPFLAELLSYQTLYSHFFQVRKLLSGVRCQSCCTYKYRSRTGRTGTLSNSVVADWSPSMKAWRCSDFWHNFCVTLNNCHIWKSFFCPPIKFTPVITSLIVCLSLSSLVITGCTFYHFEKLNKWNCCTTWNWGFAASMAATGNYQAQFPWRPLNVFTNVRERMIGECLAA